MDGTFIPRINSGAFKVLPCFFTRFRNESLEFSYADECSPFFLFAGRMYRKENVATRRLECFFCFNIFVPLVFRSSYTA